MNDAIKKYAGIDFDEVKTDEEAKALAKEHHIEYEERHTKGDIITCSLRNTARRSSFSRRSSWTTRWHISFR